MSTANEPVTTLPGEDKSHLTDGIGIALSGGGYRATLFHLGAFLRLFETGVLQQAARISSVSGGSITSAKVGLEWEHLTSRTAFFERVVEPIRGLTSVTIDVPSVLGGLFLPGSAADRVSQHYDKYLFAGATLQNLPDDVRFVINATNVETGSLWRFMKPYMRDYKVGRVDNPTVKLADAVTASSAFPPVLSPFVLNVGRDDFSEIEPDIANGFLDEIALTDGGVYDNLGLETVYKRYKTILTSDAGGTLVLDPSPPGDWAQHSKRVLDIIHGQVSNVRTRQLIEALDAGAREGAYWGIRSDIAAFGLDDTLPAPIERTTLLAQTATRLKRMPAELQERLINWGYAVSDASLRKHYLIKATSIPVFPYPETGV